MRATHALAATAALVLALAPCAPALAEQNVVENGLTGKTDVTIYREEEPRTEATTLPYTGADALGVAAVVGGVAICVAGGVVMAKGVRS